MRFRPKFSGNHTSRANHIEIHSIYDRKDLPYIKISNPPIKLLIDTGATKSFLNPEIAEKYFHDCIKHEPFTISSIFQTTSRDLCAEIPAFQEFNSNKKIKFYLFKFHHFFDGLIGYDTLKNLNVQLDLQKSVLKTPLAELPLTHYESKKKLLFFARIEPHTIETLKIPVDVANGDVTIIETRLFNCLIRECLTTSTNGYAPVEIQNRTDSVQEIYLYSPIPVKTFAAGEFEIFHVTVEHNQNFDKIDIPELIRTEHMNDEEKYHIEKLCLSFSDIFHRENSPLTFTNQVKHRIKTTDEIPVYTKSYRYPFIHKPEVQKQINDMLNQGIIRPSDSPWSSPIWIVPKKSDASGKKKWRIVVDYRKINDKTIDDRYPLPNISDILDKLGRCQYFSTLDLASGFHQLEMHFDDIKKTAFNVENGHYEYLRMPFGLKNAPATFQRVMDNVLKELINKICFVYMDDIIVFSTSLQEHLVNLKTVFQKLRESNLKVQLDKSEFLRKEVAFLGHIITPDGIKPNPDKIKAISNYPIPKTTKEIKGFLGLLGYYRKFIQNFANITKPFTNCLKKGATININDPIYIKTFEDCKALLINDPILEYPDFSKEFNLTTDASNVAIGAVLSQGIIGKDKPIAFASRTLNNAEQNYSTIEKELLAIVWATKYFRPYLFGRKFKIITDHKPLQWLMSLKEPNSRLVRWRLKLEEFDYEILYKKGKQNTNADALSRVEIYPTETVPPILQYMHEYNENPTLDPQPSTSRENDNQSIIVQADPDENNDNETVHTSAENPILTINITEKPLNYFLCQIIIIKVDQNPRIEMKRIFGNPINRTRWYIYVKNETFREQTIQFLKEYAEPKRQYVFYFQNDDDQILYKEMCQFIPETFKNSSYKLLKSNTVLQDVTRENSQQNFIKSQHEGLTNHRGIHETIDELRKKYYWPKLSDDVRKFINNCHICQQTKYERHPPLIRLQLTPTPKKPFETIHVDTFKFGNTVTLTICDSFSRFGQAYVLPSLSALHVYQSLLQFISSYKIPENIISDNGIEFAQNLLKDFAKLYQINWHYTLPLNPNSNAIVERFHSTLLEHMRTLSLTKPNLNPFEKITYAVLGYNNSIHSATKRKPIDLLLGHLELKDPIDIDNQAEPISHQINEHKEIMVELYKTIHENTSKQKSNVITKLNQKRDDPPDIEPGTIGYRKLTDRQSKTNPLYRPEHIVRSNNLTVTTPLNTYHKQVFKKPRKFIDKSLLQVDDPSGSNLDDSENPNTTPPVEPGNPTL